MDKSTEKFDPIRDKYYYPLEIFEWVVNLFFYISAVLSLFAPLISKIDYPFAYNLVQGLFVLSVATVWVTSLSINLYLMPRAQERRYQDFLSNAYGIPLTDVQTAGYYNNDAQQPTLRIASQILENSFYSSDTIIQMVRRERLKVVVYIALFLIVILNRDTDLGIVVVVTQIVFSEQILSRWFRMEWLRTQFERIYNELFRLFQAKPDQDRFEVLALEMMGRYEMAKSSAGITLSSTIFNERREKKIPEWEGIRKKLGL